ncbi:hypothetical protein [Streptomyces sp. 2P-4]|uniref:hypothetical protein n=1 Tax=Streptomyces sp. 2P-4 TaxID=2931974 RepID=UPI00254129D2|nr:hypothetical protein [Streptomyces sp. 2P-4]
MVSRTSSQGGPAARPADGAPRGPWQDFDRVMQKMLGLLETGTGRATSPSDAGGGGGGGAPADTAMGGRA